MRPGALALDSAIGNPCPVQCGANFTGPHSEFMGANFFRDDTTDRYLNPNLLNLETCSRILFGLTAKLQKFPRS